jgi:large subunit ribosomal protein L13
MRRDYKTYYAKPSEIERNWVILDAEGEILGRLAAKAASIIRGKNKPSYTPSMDTGDFVVVINAEKIRVTGKKEEQKKYYRHSGYPGGLKEESYAALMKRSPEKVIFEAVKGMLPKNRLGRALRTKLKVYKGSEHPHAAQQPVQLYSKEEAK